jgi:hypothetical protein
MAAKIATLILVLTALLLGLSVSGGWDAVTMLVTVVGSLAAGLLYGRAWGWKGLAMSIAIAIIYSAAAFAGIILWLRSQPPKGDFFNSRDSRGRRNNNRRNIPHPSNNRRNYRSNPT